MMFKRLSIGYVFTHDTFTLVDKPRVGLLQKVWEI